MSLVFTTLGLLPREKLEVKDTISETDTTREIATEWFYNGELVRRDAWVNPLRSIDIGGALAAFS